MHFIDTYNLTGILTGLFTFLIIGMFHPLVIKGEYYFGVKCWWVFLLLGIGGVAAALCVRNIFLSTCCGVFAFAAFWGIGELFKQRERVQKGWFPKRKKYLLTILLCLTLYQTMAQGAVSDSTKITKSRGDFKSPLDYMQIDEVVVQTSLKQPAEWARQPVAFTSFSLHSIEKQRIAEPKDLSVATPNLYLPDYGSKMTSSIYIRGIGARMEQPAVGLYVDNVPVLNKNNFDFDFYDIGRISILRGPQGTLYGRNAIGGVINIQTLQPLTYSGTRIAAGYGNGNDVNLALSTYQRPHNDFGYSLAVRHHQSSGFFVNEFDGNECDQMMSDGARLRLQWRLSERWSIDNVAAINFVRQDGFAYAPYADTSGNTLPINHNDPCTYRRVGVSNGTTLLYRGDALQFSSATSYQYTDDEMVLDQDFSPKSMFTLTQAQTENAVTQEFIVKSNSPQSQWEWLCGAFGFYKNVAMNAPVTFKQDGINELILANANAGIHRMFPDADLLLQESEFVIQSKFTMPALGAAVFHQSSLTLGSWKLTAGLRFDYEHTAIDYHNFADIHYRFTLTMADYKPLRTELKDAKQMNFYEVMPHFSLAYNTAAGNVYATVARGYKTGGYNTQIFSDIVQNQMMNDMMSALGVYPDNTDAAQYNAGAAIAYKPEYSWNYEIGSHLKLLDGALMLNTALFYIDCRDQQLTVFPRGQGTGRMMSNAGRTASYGAEVEANYVYENLTLGGTYGHTSARFRTYNDGHEDYAQKYIPYAPQNTASLSGEYSFGFSNAPIDNISVRIEGQGIGQIYWNESNTLVQPFYGTLGSSVSLKRDKVLLTLWGKNLTNTEYNTFYFKSIGNSFVQRGKPLQVGVSMKITV
ncbi:TonB-dependent receptor [Bacteroidia bacterium]|nr:TonB-dependent receptor [Bacteroidia bacterium]